MYIYLPITLELSQDVCVYVMYRELREPCITYHHFVLCNSEFQCEFKFEGSIDTFNSMRPK